MNDQGTAGQRDYAARMLQIEKQREDYYRKLGTPPGVPTMKGATADPDNTGYGYNTIIGELGDHSVPEGWVQRPKFNKKGDVPGPPIQWNKPEDPDNAQPGYGYVPTDTTNTEDIFFYHSDHLGSTSYITDRDANITQFDAYLPYGELLVDEHNSSEDMPYKFNGKELDEETGLYYYGARYMDPKISMWLGVDPMAEKYPNLTGYCYTMDNPIILIDPTGMEPDGWGGKNNENGTTTYTYDAKVTADNYSQLGYDVYKPNGSIINNATINGQTGENGQTSVYLGNNANDVSFTWPNSTVTPFQVGTEWLTGKGPRHRDFTNGDLFTEMLKKHEHIEDTRNMIINNVMNGGALKGTNPYKLGGIEGVGLYIRDYSTLITGGLTGNLAVTYLGSYNLDWVAKPNAENGTISVTFSIYNTSTMQSASRPPILGYLPIWQKTVGSMINKKFKKGWGSITSQSFRWTETLQMRR